MRVMMTMFNFFAPMTIATMLLLLVPALQSVGGTSIVSYNNNNNNNNDGGGGGVFFGTYDGTKYNYNGQCDLVMARSNMLGGQDGITLDIHARTETYDFAQTRISAIAVRVGTDILEVRYDGTYTFNGTKDVLFPVVMANHFTVFQFESEFSTKEGGVRNKVTTFYIEIPDTNEMGMHESIQIIVYKGMISIRIETPLPDTEGMLGHQDYNWDNSTETNTTFTTATTDNTTTGTAVSTVGMIGRDGVSVFTDPTLFALEWQVTDQEPMLFTDTNHVPQYPETCRVPIVDSRRQRQRKRRLTGTKAVPNLEPINLLQRAQQLCSTVGSENNMKEFCIQEILETGDVDAVHQYTTLV